MADKPTQNQPSEHRTSRVENPNQPSTSQHHSTAEHSFKKATDEKNFRQSYYSKLSKVGLGCDEEKIMALLNPVDVDKIRMYIKTYSLPEGHRVKIWKLLLGMTTAKGSEYIASLQKTSYDNLLRCLVTLGQVTVATTPVERNVLIYKSEDDRMYNSMCLKIQNDETLTKISETMVRNFKVSDADLYHLYRNFVNLVNTYYNLYPQLVEEVMHMIAKEDVEYEKYLRKNQEMINMIRTMFTRCLAGVLDSNLTVRLWDKVVAGYFRLLLPKIVHYILLDKKQQIIKQDYSTLLNVIPKDKLDERILSLI